MILGVGIDIIEIARIAKNMEIYGQRFLDRCFTSNEQNYAPPSALKSQGYYAKRWSAKEAFVKAIGTGFIDAIKLTEIEIYSDSLGKPMIKVSGAANEKLFQVHQNASIHLSLSDSINLATAIVIIEG